MLAAPFHVVLPCFLPSRQSFAYPALFLLLRPIFFVAFCFALRLVSVILSGRFVAFLVVHGLDIGLFSKQQLSSASRHGRPEDMLCSIHLGFLCRVLHLFLAFNFRVYLSHHGYLPGISRFAIGMLGIPQPAVPFPRPLVRRCVFF